MAMITDTQRSSGGQPTALRLAAIDLDGTLLGSDERISPRNIAAISRIRASGAQVVIVTARAFARALPFVHELGLELPLLCCSGALVADSATGRVLVHQSIRPAAALPIVRFALDHDLCLLVHAAGQYVVAPATAQRYEAMVGLVSPLLEISVDLEAVVERGATFLRGLGRETADLLHHRFAAETNGQLRFVEMASRGVPDLAIYDSRASKGNALQVLCAERGIAREAVVAIGDHHSDRSMFDAAGVRIAMGNADPELKALADFVTASNDLDGVAVALDRFFPP